MSQFVEYSRGGVAVPDPQEHWAVFYNTATGEGIFSDADRLIKLTNSPLKFPQQQWHTINLESLVPPDTVAVELWGRCIITDLTTGIDNQEIAVRQHGSSSDFQEAVVAQCVSVHYGNGVRSPFYCTVALSPDLKFDFQHRVTPSGAHYGLNLCVNKYLRA